MSITPLLGTSFMVEVMLLWRARRRGRERFGGRKQSNPTRGTKIWRGVSEGAPAKSHIFGGKATARVNAGCFPPKLIPPTPKPSNLSAIDRRWGHGHIMVYRIHIGH